MHFHHREIMCKAVITQVITKRSLGPVIVPVYFTVGGTSLFNDYFTGFASWPGAGVWLVRAANGGTVPEPGTLGLLAAALAGLALSRKKSA